jgi:hypothetical protein
MWQLVVTTCLKESAPPHVQRPYTIDGGRDMKQLAIRRSVILATAISGSVLVAAGLFL